jgi:transposase
MARQRHHYTADFKAKGALAAIKGQQTANELATTSGVHPNQVLPWKKPHSIVFSGSALSPSRLS